MNRKIPAEEQTAAADDVAEPSDADDQGGDGEQIRENDPLDGLERGAEGLRQGRQAGVGDAGVERRHQHREGESPRVPSVGTSFGFIDLLRCS